MPQTPNHGYNVPNEGAQDWHEPLNANFRQYERDIEIRDTLGNKGKYEPHAGAKFYATDFGIVFVGDGTNWQEVESTGPQPTLTGINASSDRNLGVGTATPSAKVHVRDSIKETGATNLGRHAAAVENTSTTDGADVLGLKSAVANPGSITNFVSFLDSDQQVGTIQGDGAGNIAVTGRDRLALGDGARSDHLRVGGQRPLDVRGGNNWDLDNTEGDVRIGNDDYRLAVGVALSGGGAGAVNMRAKGGVNKLNLGAGSNNVVEIQDTGVRLTNPSVTGGISIERSVDNRLTFNPSSSFGQWEFYVDDVRVCHVSRYEGWFFAPLIVQDDATIEGDLEVKGSVNSTVKNFVQPVDTDDGEKEVVYTSTEAPTPRTETSGVAELSDGRAEVDLPEHFAWVTDDGEPLVVQTTPYGGSAGLKVVERSPDRLVVEARDGEGEYEFAYTVKGTREGYADKQVVREPSAEPTTDDAPAPADD